MLILAILAAKFGIAEDSEYPCTVQDDRCSITISEAAGANYDVGFLIPPEAPRWLYIDWKVELFVKGKWVLAGRAAVIANQGLREHLLVNLPGSIKNRVQFRITAEKLNWTPEGGDWDVVVSER
jgi:hypothetical protein